MREMSWRTQSTHKRDHSAFLGSVVRTDAFSRYTSWVTNSILCFRTCTTMPVVPKDALTIPQSLAQYARENPEGVLYSHGGDSEITAREFERATHRAARLLSPGLKHGDVVGICAVYDILVYEAIMVGLMTAGLVVSNSLPFLEILCWSICSSHASCSHFPSLRVSLQVLSRICSRPRIQSV
jgi:hypothetical protein